jgi:hypothetical protein
MRTCSQCQQLVSETIRLCPKCGNALPGPLRAFAEHSIEAILNETEHTTLYKAVSGTAEPVVLRRFHDTLSNEQIERLTSDVALINGIANAHLIPIIRFDVTDAGEAFRVKPFVKGELLSRLSRRGYFQKHQNAHWVMLRLAETFSGLHGAGLLATYVVTDDVLVSMPDDPRHRSIHVDFNGSRFLDPSSDEPGPALRILMEHHPELGEGKSIASTSDVYTLGSIFHELLTGKHPDPAARGHTDLSVPEPFRDLVTQMLDPIAHRRPGDAGVVLRALENLSTVRTRRQRGVPRQMSMTRLIISLAAVVTIAVLVWWPGGTDRGTPGVPGHAATSLEEARRSVVFIQTRYTYRYLDQDPESKGKLAWSTGTGFIVDRQTIATAGHVIAPWCFNGRPLEGKVENFKYEYAVWPLGAALKGIVSPSGKSPYIYDDALVSWGNRPAVRFHALDEEHDLALLRLSDPADLPPLELATEEQYSSLVQRLRPVALIGFPRDSQDDNHVNPLLSRGSIAQLNRAGFTADLANHKGSSGGPVLDLEARVLGIATNALGGEHDFTKAASILSLAQLLSRTRATKPRVPWTP